MAKRFTSTNKWDKEWFMTLPPKLKCLWIYINDKCDQAGMWEANYSLATLHIGEQIKESDIEKFGHRVEKFAPGKIWIVEHVDFQSGDLSEKSPAHRPIFKLLKKYSLLDRVLSRVSNTLQEKEPEKEEEKELEKEKEKSTEFKQNSDSLFRDYEQWTDLICKNHDQAFEQMLMVEHIKPGSHLPNLARDHLELLASYPNRRPPDQHRFRHSLIKHIKEKLLLIKNGIRNTTSRTSSTIGSIIDPGKNYDE
jgi:hypothetical protein